jgi:hypothetical protein
VSAGSAIAQAVHALTKRATARFHGDGRYDAMYEAPADYMELNKLFTPASDRR